MLSKGNLLVIFLLEMFIRNRISCVALFFLNEGHIRGLSFDGQCSEYKTPPTDPSSSYFIIINITPMQALGNPSPCGK